jgi:hypothetical protein
MAQRRTKAIIRAKATRQRKHRRRATAKRTGVARSRAHVQVKYRGPRISRARVRLMRDDLEQTRTAVIETVKKFWVIPEQDIRQALEKTEKKIGRAVTMLQRAA